MPPKGKEAPEESRADDEESEHEEGDEQEPEEVQDERADDESGADGEDGQVQKDWTHPEGMAVSEVQQDAIYDGVITNVGQYGVFVNFGAVKDCLLKVPSKIGRRLKRGMEMRGMTCVSVDVESGKIVMVPDEEYLPEPPPRKTPQPRASSAGPGGGGGGKKRARKEWGHEGATPLEELEVGQVFEGKVTNVSPSGVFVDVGAARDARLSISTKIGRRFRIGDIVQDCTIERLDIEAGRMSCTLPDPEAAVADLPAKEPRPKAKAKAQPKAKGKAKAKVKAKAKAKALQNPREKSMEIDDLEIDAIVDGVVVSKSTAGVFLDIGCGKDARLAVSRKIGVRLMLGDELHDLRVNDLDFDPPRISVELDDPEDALAEIERLAQRSAGSSATRSRSVGPAQGSAAKRGSAATAPAMPGAAKAKAKPRAKSVGAKPTKEHKRTDGLQVNRFRSGQVADGVVTSVTPQGVSVDIGAVVDGFLRLPRAIAKQFRVRDEVHGMIIESVDVGNESILLSLDEPELEEPPAPPAKAKAKGKAKAAASSAPGGAKAKAKAKAMNVLDVAELEDLCEGDPVDCIVTNVGPFGVFVDVGASKDGRLSIPRADVRKFLKGDRIEGAFIEEVDVEAEQFSVGLPDDMLQELAEAPLATPQSAAGGRSPARPSGGSAGGGGGARGSAAAARSPPPRAAAPAPQVAGKPRPKAKGSASSGGGGLRRATVR